MKFLVDKFKHDRSKTIYSQEGLAEACNVSLNTIKNVELLRRKVTPTDALFNEMCKVSKNIVSDFSKGFSPIGVGIHNLSNHDCSEILKLKNEFLDEYNKAYEETLKKSIIEEKGVSYSRKFFTSKFIPYYGRISTNTATSHNRVYRAKITPVLDSDSKDEILSRHEYFIVSEWCRTLKEKYDAIRKEEEE